MIVPSSTILYMILLVVQILFGLNFVASKIVLKSFAPSPFAFWRFFLSGICMGLILFLMKRPFPKFKKGQATQFAIYSVLGIILGQTLMLFGLSKTSSVNTAIIATSIPMFIMLVSFARGQERPGWNKWLGSVIALIGLLILRDFSQIEFSEATMLGDILVLVSCLCLGASISFGRDLFQTFDPYWGTSLSFTLGSIPLLLFAISRSHPIMPPMTSGDFTWAFLYTIFIATLLTYFLTNWVLQFFSSNVVGVFIYLQPIFASLFAYLILDDIVTWRHFLSATTIFIGLTCFFLGSMDKVE